MEAPDEDARRTYEAITTQAEQRQNRDGRVTPAKRPDRIDGRRWLALELLKQAIKDLKDSCYKGKDPDPDPVRWIEGKVEGPAFAVEHACKHAGVSVRRYRKRAREIIRKANGPLSGRDWATQGELDADAHDWLAIKDFPITANRVSKWANHGEVTALKVHPGNWRIRLDQTLKDRLEKYRGNSQVGEVPAAETFA